MFSYTPMYLTINGKFRQPSTPIMFIGYQNAQLLVSGLKDHIGDSPLVTGQVVTPSGYAAPYNQLVYGGYRCLCETLEQALFIANINNSCASIHLLNRHNPNKSILVESDNLLSDILLDANKLNMVLNDYQEYYPDFVASADYTLINRDEAYMQAMRHDYVCHISPQCVSGIKPRNSTEKYFLLVRQGALQPLWFDDNIN